MTQDPIPVRVLVADPHSCVREGLKAILNTQPDLCVVGEAADGPTALARARDLNPDLVVLEASLPGLDGAQVTVKGPKGTLEHTVAAPITVVKGDGDAAGTLQVSRPDDERDSRALHGLTRTLVNNMVIGVTQGYSKGLEIVGVGYRVAAKGKDLEFALGYSHPVVFEAPQGITLSVEGTNKIHVDGIDKQQVGQVAAKIRSLRAPEPYKGKGVRYEGEVIRKKLGKAGKAGKK